MTYGVLQGGVLGLLLFLLFINEIPSHTKHSDIRLLADDCILYRKIDDSKDCDLLQAALNGPLDRENKWKLSFHLEKCFVLSTMLKRNKTAACNYFMKEHQLQSVMPNTLVLTSMANCLGQVILERYLVTHTRN